MDTAPSHPQVLKFRVLTFAASGRRGVLLKDQAAARARWEKNHCSTVLFRLYVGDQPLRSDARFAEVKGNMRIRN